MAYLFSTHIAVYFISYNNW